MDVSPPGSSVYGISQARILEWVAISSSRGSSQPRDRTHISCRWSPAWDRHIFFFYWLSHQGRPALEYAPLKTYLFGTGLFWETTDREEALKTKEKLLFAREMYICQGNFHLCRCLPLWTKKKRISLGHKGPTIHGGDSLKSIEQSLPCLPCSSW